MGAMAARCSYPTRCVDESGTLRCGWGPAVDAASAGAILLYPEVVESNRAGDANQGYHLGRKGCQSGMYFFMYSASPRVVRPQLR